MNKILLIILLLSIISLASGFKTKLSRPIEKGDVICDNPFDLGPFLKCDCLNKFAWTDYHTKMKYCAKTKTRMFIIESPKKWIDEYTLKRRF